MSEFYSLLDEYLGDSNAIDDIRVVVRRLWFYDFVGYPTYVWDGQGTLITSDGIEWLGSIDGNGTNYHEAPSLQDGRDGSSATYNFTLTVPDLPNQSAGELFEQLKADQSRATNRSLTCYLAIFLQGEALRPTTPKVFYKDLTMIEPRFSEKVESPDGRQLQRIYKTTVTAKDSNYGRSNKPNGTYADTIQKRRAAELGVSVDLGSEHLAGLSNRTYTIP